VIRVASVPSGHVYVRHLASPFPEPADVTVTRLTDPDPDDPRRSTFSRWWPPAMLEPSWVQGNADAFDVFHLQFGFDARTPLQLAQLADTLREAGKPLVYTVHDLRNPHHTTRTEHDAQLDVLIPAADALITLTPGAAAEIAHRWGRTANVLAHPHVVDFDTMRAVQDARAAAPAREPGAPFRVGVHVKSLRASMNPLPVLTALVDAVAELPGAVLQVDGHTDVMSPDGLRYDDALAGYLRDAHARGDLDLRVHDYFTDAELWEYLAALDVSVLPYRFGTHSGWLEACRDLGTAVIAPDCGYYAEQGPVFGYHNDEHEGPNAASLRDALHSAYAAGPADALSVEWRRQQRAEIAAAHLEIYRALGA
jgi:glycosyltransferase involved in cell wall biosynthesis